MSDTARTNPPPSHSSPRRRLVIVIVIALVGLAVLIVGAVTIALAVSQHDEAGADGDRPGSAPAPPSHDDEDDDTSATAQATDATCPEPTVNVATGEDLQAALDDAHPGDVIGLAPGRYEGEFVMTADGRPDDPITLCGTRESVLDGGAIEGGYVFHLDGAKHWRAPGFTVSNGQKGVMADGTTGRSSRASPCHGTGDEAIHLRNGSTDNLVLDNTISDTGLAQAEVRRGRLHRHRREQLVRHHRLRARRAATATSSKATRSRDTTSETVDIKEGTTGGVLVGNTFDGAAMAEADSWVDVKGNNWLIQGNTGTGSPADGFQTHEILDGWGNGNVFRENTANLSADGVRLLPEPERRQRRGSCDNTVTGPRAELTNVDCRD